MPSFHGRKIINALEPERAPVWAARSKVRGESCRHARTICSPPGRARATLERTNNLRGDPTAVKVTILEGHLLVVDLAGIHVTRVEGHPGTERLETPGGFRVGPPGTGNDDSAGNDIEVLRFSLELAEAGSLDRDEHTGRE